MGDEKCVATLAEEIVAELPWGSVKSTVTSDVPEVNLKPGEFVAQSLFIDLVVYAEKKIAAVVVEPIEKPLSKTFQRGEDAQFDQMISTLGRLSENCLPSILRSLFQWHDQQSMQLKKMLQSVGAGSSDSGKQVQKIDPKIEANLLIEKRLFAVDFIFCRVLIETLPQLKLHPGIEDLVEHIIQMAFLKFRLNDYPNVEPNSSDARVISELFSEVVGHLGSVRFALVRKRFKQELDELRSKDGVANTNSIISLLVGMKFFRVKMAPISEFESSMRFLQDLAAYFLEVKERDIKQALAGLFIEILLPLGANAKTEVNVPSVKAFVEMLYSHTLDLATKKKHSLVAFFPLLTCLLCISHKQFFLTNWHCFLTLCLSNLKNKDSKVSRIALESLHRLVWVYVVRVKCENNTATLSRLQSICNSLFPKGGRGVVPRNTPLNIFVKILHFIAQERLDFVFKEVIFDLLCVGRQIRTIYSERMNIGLRALLVIADSLQQKDGPPPMPRGINTLPSGGTLRVRRIYLARPLMADVARNIGIDLYYGPCRRAFDGILRLLDSQVGKPLIMFLVQTSGKEMDDILGGDRKPKIDLFRTCLAAIPRLLPEGMSRHELVEMLARLTLHIDEELRLLACQALQNLIVQCVDWHEDVIYGFLQFFIREITDANPLLIDSSLRLLLQMLSCWKSVLSFVEERKSSDAFENEEDPASQLSVPPMLRSEGNAMVLHCIEGFALTMLCQNRCTPRKLAVTILKEVKSLLPVFCVNEDFDTPVMDVLDESCAYILEKYIQHTSEAEKACWLSSPHLDFLWLCDKISSIEVNFNLVSLDNGNEYFQWDPWAVALSGFTEEQRLLQKCPTAVSYAWPAVHTRLTNVFSFIDPNSPQNDGRASLLRSSKSKATSACGSTQEAISYSNFLGLWQKYLVLACAIAPPPRSFHPVLRSVSPVTLQCDALENSRPTDLKIPRVAHVSATHLFRLVLPLMRCEMTDIRDSVVLGLGSINPHAFESLLEDLSPYLREAGERKQENLRRKRRRDILRVQLIRLFEMAIFRGCFNVVSITQPNSNCLKAFLLDFIDNGRCYLEADQDCDMQIGYALHLHFAKMVTLLIGSVAVEKRTNLLSNELRKNLFYLFASWSGRLGLVFDKRHVRDKDLLNSQEAFAVMAMCSTLTCGPVFDSQAISDENGYIFGWLEALVQSRNEKISEVSKETLMLLLEFNSDATNLLDWLVDRCYSSPSHVADKCFRAVVTVFLLREYPCDFIAMFNLALLYVGYPLNRMRNLALELIQVLQKRFFDENALCCQADDRDSTKTCRQNDQVVSFCKPQLLLSEQLSELHPEVTMPIFSEICLRLRSARPARRASMLNYLAPWLRNVELMDPFLEPPDRAPALSLSAKMCESHAVARRVLKGDGWGSAQATEMILNNMLYITVQYGNEHPQLIESLWANLISCWPQNVRIIFRFFSVMTILAPDALLDYVKRILVYFIRMCPERVINVLIAELETIDFFRYPLERTEVPPYYRWVRREEDGGDHTHDSDSTITAEVEHLQGKEVESLPTTEHEDGFGEEDAILLEPAGSMTSLLTLKAEDFNSDCAFATNSSAHERGYKAKEFVNPFQLPMPAYGGHYCPLSEYLPPVDQVVILCHRCHIAAIFLTDLVVADKEIDWSVHLPLMLHVAFLGLDHSRPVVNNHCKQLLINLAAMCGLRNSSDSVMTRVLNSRNVWAHPLLSKRSPESVSSISLLSETGSNSGSSVSGDSGCQLSLYSSNIQCAMEKRLFTDMDNAVDLTLAVADFLASREGISLWPAEDTVNNKGNRSSVILLSRLAQQINHLFSLALPSARIESRWAQTALHIAVCSLNRHYASRSFQILRALRVPLTSRMINDILARLVEIICEYNEDMLAYVTEIMYTLEASIVPMEMAEHSLVNLFKSQLIVQTPESLEQSRTSPTHQRSTSCFVDAKPLTSDFAVAAPCAKANLKIPRSKSAQVISSDSQDDHMNALTQLFWIAISILESDIELQFLMALKLVDRILDMFPMERQDCFDRLMRMTEQLNWTSFPGIQRLVLKGCTFANSYEATVNLIVKLIPLLDCKVVGSCQLSALSLSVIASLPYAILHYDQPTKLSLTFCDTVANYCACRLESDVEPGQSSDHPLEHLATIMRLYQKRSFRKECLQWTRCVIKYLHDLYPSNDMAILSFLTEMLDRGPACSHAAVLQIMKAVFVHVDFTADYFAFINGHFLKVVAKHVQGPNWKEASAILALAVSRSSSLSKPSSSVGHFDQEMLKKELPGRTMEFQVDFSLVQKKRLLSSVDAELSAVGKRPADLSTIARRPFGNQVQVREHLIALLNTSGLRVGLIRSPSIIFSQSSHEVICEQMSSAYSSSGELTAVMDQLSTTSPVNSFNDITSETYAPVFKEFDFLEGEQDSQSESTESCFNWLATLRSKPIEYEGADSPGTETTGKDAVDSGGWQNSESDLSDEEESVLEEVQELPVVGDLEQIFIANSSPAEKSPDEPLGTPTSSFTSSVYEVVESSPESLELCRNRLPLNLECPHHCTGHIEDAWNDCFAKIMNNNGSIASGPLMFTQMLREVAHKVSGLIRDSCHFLSMSNVFQDVNGQFSDCVGVLMKIADFPFLFVGNVQAERGDVYRRHKYYLMELNQHFEAYLERKEQAIKVLNGLKSALKLQLLVTKMSNSSAEQGLQLCRALHKLLFQVFLMAECMSKIHHYVLDHVGSEVNLSPEISQLQRQLLCATNDLGASSEAKRSQYDAQVSPCQKLYSLIGAKEVRESLVHLRSIRLNHRRLESLGCCEQVDVEVLLLLYCQTLAAKGKCFVAIIGCDALVDEACGLLMEFNISLAGQIRNLTDKVKLPYQDLPSPDVA